MLNLLKCDDFPVKTKMFRTCSGWKFDPHWNHIMFYAALKCCRCDQGTVSFAWGPWVSTSGNGACMKTRSGLDWEASGEAINLSSFRWQLLWLTCSLADLAFCFELITKRRVRNCVIKCWQEFQGESRVFALDCTFANVPRLSGSFVLTKELSEYLAETSIWYR